MKKIILGIVVLVLLAAMIAAAVYWKMRPQVITFKDGATLTLVGVTYGKHHVFKGIRTGGSFRRGHNTVDTTNDTVVVWIELRHKSQWENYQLFVYDTANTACVGMSQNTSTHVKAGIDIQAFTLNAFPRRDSKMILRAVSWGNYGGMRLAKGQFVVSNPGPRSFSEWQPEPMPDTQADGDLNVTLTKCVVGGNGMFFNGGGDNKDPMHKGVLVAFHTEQNGSVVTNWQPVSIQTSDATGNQSGQWSWGTSKDTNNDATMTYQWGLWPNEPAWKLRVEMSRTSGFTEAESWNLTNVPIHKGTWQSLWNYQPRRFGYVDHSETNSAYAQTTINGIHLSVFPIIRVTDQNWGMGQHPGGVRVVADPDIPPGYRLSVLAINEHGHRLQAWGPNGGNGNYICQLQDIGNAQSLNLTVALHKSRFVEFTVKPAMP